MLVIASSSHQSHDGVEISGGELIRSYECPERADWISAALQTAGHEFLQPAAIEVDLLQKIHTPEYLDFLASAWQRWDARGTGVQAAMGFIWPARGFGATRPDDIVGQLGFHSFAADTSIVAGTWDAAVGAATIAMTAADRVADGQAPAYGLCRPPGHHATADQFGGYCYLNNAAVAAQRLLDRGAERVAILDVDYHHGNGTQAIFYDRSDVLFLSIHADPRHEFPWFSGYADEWGAGAGEGWNLNLPLPPDSGFGVWKEALAVALRRLAENSVDAIVVSLGVDTFAQDPIGQFTLGTADFTTAAQHIAAAGKPLVVVQEGGYAVAEIGANVAAFLEPLS